MGRCVGKAGEGRGYVPDPGRAFGSGTATPGSGGWAVALSASAPVRGLLGERSRADDADRIWALARVSCVRGVTPAGDARRVRGQSAPSPALPSVALGERGPGRAARRARSQAGAAARVRAGARGGKLAPGRRLRPRGRLGVAPRRPGRQGVSPRRHPLRPDEPACGSSAPAPAARPTSSCCRAGTTTTSCRRARGPGHARTPWSRQCLRERLGWARRRKATVVEWKEHDAGGGRCVLVLRDRDQAAIERATAQHLRQAGLRVAGYVITLREFR